MEFIIYADESVSKGDYYSNFYGGALVRSGDLASVLEILARTKQELHLFGEVKWSKVTEPYLSKYQALMDVFFDLVRADRVKVRIMFTHEFMVPQGLGKYHREHEYHLLYYQFIKHAFGLRYSNEGEEKISLRIYLDRMPGKKEKRRRFKEFVVSLQDWDGFRAAGIQIDAEQVAEVVSHDHDILQCLDIVTGAIQFRLNDHHKRGKGRRTSAKTELYKSILGRIQEIYPGFNIGITTGRKGDWANLWHHQYRHWSFASKNSKTDYSKAKRKKPRYR